MRFCVRESVLFVRVRSQAEAVQSGDVLLQPHPTRAEPNAARRPGRSLIQVVRSLNHGLFDRLKKLSGLGREVLGLSEVVGCV